MISDNTFFKICMGALLSALLALGLSILFFPKLARFVGEEVGEERKWSISWKWS